MISRPESSLEQRLRESVRDIPDFPRSGILFRDITPVLANPPLFQDAIEALGQRLAAHRVSHVVAIESRGFIFGAPVAVAIGAAFVPVRKAGKLPHATERVTYSLEYGEDALEIHRDACGHEWPPAPLAMGDRARTEPARVAIVDDLLATGGTAAAARTLVERVGGQVVACAVLIELAALGGRARLGAVPVEALLVY